MSHTIGLRTTGTRITKPGGSVGMIGKPAGSVERSAPSRWAWIRTWPRWPRRGKLDV